MKKIIYSIVLILTILFSKAGVAAHVKSLYEAEIPVATQGGQVGNGLLNQAFQQVLVKITGSKKILENPSIKIPTSELAAMMQEYGYITLSGHNQPPYLLQIKFDPVSVKQWLEKVNIPAWSDERPLLLVWAEEGVQSPEMIGSDSLSPMRTLLQQYAKQRGLPILFPMMDLTDLNQISAADVTAMAVPALQNAAKRYNSDGLLIVVVTPVGKTFQLKARLVSEGDQRDWDLQANTLAEGLQTLVNQVTDSLAERYATAVSATEKTHIILKVTGILDVNDLARLIRYLKRLTIVKDVQPIQVTGQEVMLSLSLCGDEQAFVQAVSAEKKLTPVPVAADATDKMMVYQWNP